MYSVLKKLKARTCCSDMLIIIIIIIIIIIMENLLVFLNVQL